MFELIIQPLQLFFNGASGKDRQAKRRLTKKLRQARVDYDYLRYDQDCLERNYQEINQERDRLKLEGDRLINQHNQLKENYLQLQQRHSQLKENYLQLEQNHKNWTVEQEETRKLFTIASDENKKFAVEKENLALRLQVAKDENIQLFGEVAVLEDELMRQSYQHTQHNHQTQQIANTHKTSVSAVSLECLSNIDLSDTSIAVVGGHDNTRHHVIKSLRDNHGIKKHHIHEVSHDRTSDRGSIKDKIQHCDFVFIITGYMSHTLSKSVMQLKHKAAIKGDVIPLEPRGATGVLREILTYIASGSPSA